MCTVLVTYDPNDKMAQGLMDVLAMTRGVEIDDDVWLTEDEIKRMEKAEKSGICTDMENLKEYLKSQL
jgi:hypothetical protein